MAHTQLVAKENESGLPPILAGRATPDVRKRAEQFFFSIAGIFESWVARRQSLHTQRAYREDIMAFVKFMGIEWPGQAPQLLRISVQDVQAFRDQLRTHDAAPQDVEPPHLLVVELL